MDCGLDFNKKHAVLTKRDFLYCLLNKAYHDYYIYK